MLLQLDEVRVRYPNGALGVLDVSLSVDKGQVVALFGPNGAGKSTITRAIGGFLKGEGARIINGAITFEGRTIQGMEPHRASSLGIAIVPERNKVFSNLTVTQNLNALGVLPPNYKEILAWVYELFPVLQTRRHQLAGRLSGGERQMLAIGRALLLNPKLMVIDEMTLGLHHSLQPALYDVVRKISAGGTSVLVVDESNGLALEVADYCFALSEGRIVDSGLPDQFRGKFAATDALGMVE